MGAGAEGIDLGSFADAAENRGDAQRQMFAVGPDVFINLQGEFAGWREYQRACAGLAAVADDGAKRVSIGRVKAAVLPVPVWAMPMRSWPARIGGMAAAWMGVGSV